MSCLGNIVGRHPILHELHVDLVDLADATCCHDLARLPDHRETRHDVGDAKYASRSGCGINQGISVGHLIGQRLVTKHVNPGIKEGQRRFVMHMIGRGDHYRINTIGAIGFSIGHLDERGVTPLFGQVPIPRGRFGAGGIRRQRPSHDLPAVRQPRRHCLSMRYSPSANHTKAQAAGLRGVGSGKV